VTLVKEVRNWYSVLAVYLNIKRSVVARFRNGGFTAISRIEYHKFQEELFMRYLQDNDYVYSTNDGKKVVHTPDGLQIICSKLPFSAYINETVRERVYGMFDIKGRVVIDSGAYVAETCLYFALQGNHRIFVVS